ncbi:MAG: cytochrome c biogenesis protein ResB, partial [Bacteroidales bacterium]|nr:cytochrome c biogenesis protein ResB [Bacteroidales bacterium]
MKKIINIIFSIQLTGILLMLFALTIGFATFIENDFGTEAAKAKVYNARWFEFILLLLSINLTGSIFRYKMYLKKKWTMFLFHIGFLVIFIGAASTRYIGFEGMMSIREGKSSDEMTSDKTFISVWADDGNVEDYSETRVFATPVSIIGFDDKLSLPNRAINIEALDYYTNVAETVVEEEGGKPIVW